VRAAIGLYLEEAEKTVLNAKAKTFAKRFRARFEAGLDATQAETEKRKHTK
jgi:hypothetical protein